MTSYALCCLFSVAPWAINCGILVLAKPGELLGENFKGNPGFYPSTFGVLGGGYHQI